MPMDSKQLYVLIMQNIRTKHWLAVTRHIKNIYTWEKNETNKKKRIKSAINNISEYLATFLHYNTQQLFLYKRTVKPFTR